MPFVAPVKKPRPPSRPVSPPSRNPSSSSSATVSSTSSLEAVPIRSPPPQLRSAARTPDLQGRLTSFSEQAGGGSGPPRRLHVFDNRGSSGGSSSGSARGLSVGTDFPPPTPFQTQSQAAQNSHPQQGSSYSPETPRGSRQLPPMAHYAPIRAHLLPLELRASASGPDLASLRLQAKMDRSVERQRAVNGGGSGEENEAKKLNGRGKLRSRSSPAEVGQDSHSADRTVISAIPHLIGMGLGSASHPSSSARATPLAESARKTVGLQDFLFGEAIGKGSYSTVILAQHKATNIPYAIKVLDQHHLVQEKKTKYAKVERDALVLLGPKTGKATGGASSKTASKSRRGSGGSVTSAKGSSGATDATSPTATVTISTGSPPTTTARTSLSEAGDGRRERGSTLSSHAPSSFKAPIPASPAPTIRMRRATADVVDNSNVEREQQPDHEREQDQGMSTSTDATTDAKISNSVSNLKIDVDIAQNGGLHPPSKTSPETRRGHAHSSSLVSCISSLAMSPDSSSSMGSLGVGPGAGPSSRRESHSSHKRPILSHPGIVKLHYTFKDETSLYFVLDLAINGELLDIIKSYGSLDLESARRYAAQLIDVIQFMHERGVIHRDLKPENILLDDNMRVKLTDFGSAKIIKNEEETNGANEGASGKKRSFVGTAEYVSPEVLRNEPVTFASDVWAFGCILFQLIAGRPPFRGATEYLTFQKVLQRDFEYPEGFDELAKDLTERILRLDPKERLTVEQIKSHPFFSGIDFDRIWTDQVPEIHSGIVVPEPIQNSNEVSQERWNDLFGTPVDEDMNFDDETDLEEPRRRWIEHGGAIGTFSSGSVATEDGISLTADTSDRRESMSMRWSSHCDIKEEVASSVPKRSSAQMYRAEHGHTWDQYLLPDERVVYSSPILTRSRLTMPKRRTLILTNFPRLICAKEDKGDIKMKGEIILALKKAGGSADSKLAIEVLEKGPRAFVVRTSGKDYVFIADREDLRDRWMQELVKAQAS